MNLRQIGSLASLLSVDNQGNNPEMEACANKGVSESPNFTLIASENIGQRLCIRSSSQTSLLLTTMSPPLRLMLHVASTVRHHLGLVVATHALQQ